MTPTPHPQPSDDDWHSVKGKMPKEGEFVLARLEWPSGKSTYAILEYKILEDNAPWLCEGDELSFSVNVTHWRYFSTYEDSIKPKPSDDMGEIQKKLQQDIRDMFQLEAQRNEINFALSGVERGDMTMQDYEDDLSLAISNYFVKDILLAHRAEWEREARVDELHLFSEAMREGFDNANDANTFCDYGRKRQATLTPSGEDIRAHKYLT